MLVADSIVKADSPILAVSSTPSPTSSPTSTPSPTLTPRIVSKWTQVDGYLWWLVEWGSNKVLCDLTIDHADEPIGTDILYGCGQVIYNTWMTSDGCASPHGGKDATSCPGFAIPYGDDDANSICYGSSNILIDQYCGFHCNSHICINVRADCFCHAFPYGDDVANINSCHGYGD